MNDLFDTMSLDHFDIANGQQLKKCKLFSMTETCVTLDPQNGALQLEVSVGALKAKEGFAASAWDTENELFAFDDDDDDIGAYEYYEFSAEDVEDEWFDENEQVQWMVTNVA